MARLFNGSSAVITCAGGGTTAMTGAYTFAAIVKRNGTSAMAMMCLDTSGGAPRMEMLIHSNANSNLLTVWQGVASLSVAGVSLVNADGWALIAVSHTGAGAALRGHRYLYSDGSVIHSNGTTDGDLSASGAGGAVTIGEGDGDFWAGDIAIVGAWNRALSDAEIEQLPFTQFAWLGSAPVGLWHLDQSATGQAVGDLTGGGANQTSQANTSVSANSVPVFNYGDGPWLVIRPQAGGGSSTTRDLAGSQPAATGTLARILQALRSLAGSQPSATGVLTRTAGSFNRSLAGAQPNATGALSRILQALRSLAGNQPNATGVLTRKYQALRSLAGSQPTATGVLNAALIATRSLGGSQPTATGVLAALKITARTLAGSQPAATGVLSKLLSAFRALTGSQPTATGALTRTASGFHRALTGAQPAPSGQLARIFATTRLVAGSQPAATGSLIAQLIGAETPGTVHGGPRVLSSVAAGPQLLGGVHGGPAQ